MSKSFARLALVGAALVLGSSALRAQTPSPVSLSPLAERTLDSLATIARVERIETSACVTQYADAGAGITIQTLGPIAPGARVDSVSITPQSGTAMCEYGEPTVHAHVAFGGVPWPSPTDLRSKALRGQPFGLLLVVTDSSWSLVRY